MTAARSTTMDSAPSFPCPFSVEVVASSTSRDDDVKISTSSFAPIVSGSCLADEVCEQDEDGPAALVPVGSNSDSEDSDIEDIVEVGEALMASSTTQDVVASSPVTAVTAEDSGMYDCLSDQFSNLFCPGDQSFCIPRSAWEASTKDPAYNPVTTTCTDLPLQELFASGDRSDMFSWFHSPNQEGPMTRPTDQTPQNRSSTCRKRNKSAYIKRLWSSWHPECTIPIERSKSMPIEPTRSTLDLQFDVFYDSDPEQEHCERKTRKESLKTPQVLPRHKRQRPPSIQTIFEHETCSSFDDHNDCYEQHQQQYMCPPTPRNSVAAPSSNFDPNYHASPMANENSGPWLFDSPQGPMDELDLMDPRGEAYLKQFIQEVTNTKLQLVWHRRSIEETNATTVTTKATTAEPPISAPLAVTGIFEVGAHLDRLVVQPKFTWSPAYEPNLEDRKICLSGGEPNFVELLSIIRVVVPQALNRNLYPFARLDRTCCITTNDEEFPFLVLEATTPGERDWLVTAMKVIVARLASIIIVRDESMLLEFFTPYSALMSLAEEQAAMMDDEKEYLEEAQHYHHHRYKTQDDHDHDGPALDPNGELQLISYNH